MRPYSNHSSYFASEHQCRTADAEPREMKPEIFKTSVELHDKKDASCWQSILWYILIVNKPFHSHSEGGNPISFSHYPHLLLLSEWRCFGATNIVMG